MDILSLVAKVKAGGYTPSTQEAHALHEYDDQCMQEAIRQYEAVAKAYPSVEPRYRACIGRTYQDPQGRKITVLGPDPLFPDGRYMRVAREDDDTWITRTDRLCAALGIA